MICDGFEFIIFDFNVLVFMIFQDRFFKDFDPFKQIDEQLFVDVGDLAVCHRVFVAALFDHASRYTHRRGIIRDTFNDNGIRADTAIFNVMMMSPSIFAPDPMTV